MALVRRVLPIVLVAIAACSAPPDIALPPEGTGEAIIIVHESEDGAYAVYLAPNDGSPLPLAVPPNLLKTVMLFYNTCAETELPDCNQLVRVPVTAKGGRAIPPGTGGMFERAPGADDWDSEMVMMPGARLKLAPQPPPVMVQRPLPRASVEMGPCVTWTTMTEGARRCLPPIPPPGGCDDTRREVSFYPFVECKPIVVCEAGDFSTRNFTTPVYVRAGAAVSGQGTMADPYPTITAALGAGTSTTIVIGAGRYPESVTVSSGAVRLVGKCPESTIIEGNVSVSGGSAVFEDLSLESPMGPPAITASGNVTFRSSWIEAAGTVLSLNQPGTFTLERTALRVPVVLRTGAINIASGTRFTATNLDFRDTATMGNDGVLISAVDGADLHIERASFRLGDATIINSRGVLTIDQVDILHTVSSALPSLDVSNGTATFTELAIRRSGGSAIDAGGGILDIDHFLVESTDGSLGVALDIHGPTTNVTAHDVRTIGANLLAASEPMSPTKPAVRITRVVSEGAPGPVVRVVDKTTTTMDLVELDARGTIVEADTSAELTLTNATLVTDSDSEAPTISLRDGALLLMMESDIRAGRGAAADIDGGRMTCQNQVIFASSSAPTLRVSDATDFNLSDTWVDGSVSVDASQVTLENVQIVSPASLRDSLATLHIQNVDGAPGASLKSVYIEAADSMAVGAFVAGAVNVVEGLTIVGPFEIGMVLTNDSEGTATNVVVDGATTGLDITGPAVIEDAHIRNIGGTALRVTGDLTANRIDIVKADTGIARGAGAAELTANTITIYETRCGYDVTGLDVINPENITPIDTMELTCGTP